MEFLIDVNGQFIPLTINSLRRIFFMADRPTLAMAPASSQSINSS